MILGTRSRGEIVPYADPPNRLLVGHDVEHVDPHGRVLRGQPDHDSGPARADHVDSELHRIDRADGDDRPVVALPRCTCDQIRERVLISNVHARGCAEARRLLEPLQRGVEGDDLRRATQAGALNSVHSDTAGADDRAATTSRNLKGFDCRADAGDDRAADQRRNIGGHVVGQRDHAALGDDGVVGKAGEQGVGGDRAIRACDR